MKLVRVHPGILEKIWPLLTDGIQSMAERSNGRYTQATIFNSITNDEYQLWVIVKDDDPNDLRAIVVTQVLRYPTGIEEFTIVGVTGHRREDWIHFLGDLEDWAKSEGCKISKLTARPGWAPHLKETHVKTHVVLERNLT